MASEWQRHEVKALIEDEILLIGDGYRAKNQELASSGLPFARAGNVNNGFRFEDADRFPEAHVARVGNKISQPGDVVFTSKGTVGRFAFVRPDTPRFVYSPQLCFWRSLNKDVIEPRFLYYWMQGREFFIQFKGVAGQTDMAEYVSLSDQRRMHITLPPIADQRAIAHILGTLDDKIEINRKQNETLEAMARALFKAWFVDFEPVRAKMEGRWQRGQSLPGLPAKLYDLFPDRLVESEIGEIPEGWWTNRISDYLSLAYGKSLPAGKRKKGICPVYGSGGLAGFHNEAMINGPTVIVGRKGTVGSLYWEDRPCFPIDTVFYVQPKAPLSFCYYMLESLPLRDMNTDAAVPGLNRENVYRLEVVAPPSELVSHFAETASRFRERISEISSSRESLSQLRNTLLPKLISGELRIADAEAFLKGHGV